VSRVSHAIDRIEVIFDDETLVADAGLIVPATLMVRLGLEAVVNQTVRLVGRVGGALPGRKVLTLVAAILAGGSHIDHANKLRAGATGEVLPFRVMAPSTLGTFLRAFSFGHVRQLDRVIAETIRRAWSLGAGPGNGPVTIDLDSTICEVHGKQKHGAAYGYTRQFGYHPLLATRAGTGEVLHTRLRKGSSQRGHKRFVEELIARVRRGGATGALTVRADSGFFSWDLIKTLNATGRLVDHGEPKPQRSQGDRRHQPERLDRHRLPRRRASPGRRDHLRHRRRHNQAKRASRPARGAPHPPHRPRPGTAVA
jgi:hypothetical protein